jgi:hypothetical protein
MRVPLPGNHFTALWAFNLCLHRSNSINKINTLQIIGNRALLNKADMESAFQLKLIPGAIPTDRLSAGFR